MDAPSTTQPMIEIDKNARKNGLYISSLVMLVAVILGLYGVLTQFQDGTNNLLGLPWVGALLILGAIGFYLCWQNRLQTAVNFLIISLILMVSSVALLFDGAATALSGMFTAAQITILFLIAPSRQNIRTIVFVIVANTLVLLVDQFGPGNRAEIASNQIQLFNWLSIGALLFLFIIGLRNFLFYSIRYKIFIAILAGSILSVIVISLSVNFTTRRSLIESSSRDLKQIAEREAFSFGELINQEVEIVKSMTLNQIVQNGALFQSAQYNGTPEQIEAQLLAADATYIAADPEDSVVQRVLGTQTSTLLRQFQTEFPDHVVMVATDKYGGLVGSTEKVSAYYQRDNAWWQAAYNDGAGGLYIGDPAFDEDAQQYGINIAFPIFAPAEDLTEAPEVVGVLRTVYSLDRLDQLLQGAFDTSSTSDRIEFHLGREIELIVSADGSVEVEEMTSEEVAEFEQFLREGQEAEFVLFEEDGEETLSTFAAIRTHDPESPINGLGWFVHVLRPQREILAVVEQQNRNTILLSVAAVIASAIAALALGQVITRPIVELTNAARRIEAGDRLVRAEVQSNDELSEMASAINRMMEELRVSVEMREQRVAERTQALVVATEVGRELTSILDLDLLLQSVVNKVNHAFDYYHVQIYLWNDERSRLIMQRGTGKIGQALLDKRHAIEAGKGVVGRAAESKTPIFVPEVRGSARPDYWLSNPLLPDTVSEAAVPLLVGDSVIGVLDVQEDVPGKMTAEDVDILQIVAGQISVAIQNAKLYTLSRRRAENEAMLLEISRKIQSTTTVESAMKTAVVELGKFMGSKASISLGESRTPANGDEPSQTS